MPAALHVTPDGRFTAITLTDETTIATTIGTSDHASLTSHAGHYTFWFVPSLKPVNRRATELLLALTNFTATSVPLLRGDVIITANDAHGNLASCTQPQLDHLFQTRPGRRDERRLVRRYVHAAKCRRNTASRDADLHPVH
ncbi:hypothetical protein [Mycobacterium sp. shizuoka-1]|jgi:hypothetical protein|uniref:hypothetical protein n=1 Tax=Mycobacterium sp. shizuoka-1 TaxID=2039281 RepID=UPI000C0636A1|nr:hypothetical protein [Mycobacterium sp. shizuoka-1]GAY18566.1 hypothetical protein MSZK_52920 [Mycobacterium sp. shizuoka-1]